MVGWKQNNPGKKNQGFGQKPSPVIKKAYPPKSFNKKVDKKLDSIALLETGLESIKGPATRIKENLKSIQLSLTAKPPISPFDELAHKKAQSSFRIPSGPGSTSATGQSSQQGSFTRSGLSYGTSQSSYETADESYLEKMKAMYEGSFRWDSTS